MTVTSTINRISYPGPQIAGYEYDYAFFIGKVDEIYVEWYDTDGIPTKLAEYVPGGTGLTFEIAGVGDTDPGTWLLKLKLDDADHELLLDETLLIRLKPPLVQLVSFARGGSFKGYKHEYLVYDYIVRCALGQQEELDRCTVDLLDTLLDIVVSNDITLGGEDASDEIMPSQNAVNQYMEIDPDVLLGGLLTSDAVLPSQNAAYEYILAIVEDLVGTDPDKAPSRNAVNGVVTPYTYTPEGFGQQHSVFIDQKPSSGGMAKRITVPLPENEFTEAPDFAFLNFTTYGERPALNTCRYIPELSNSREAVFDVFKCNEGYWGSFVAYNYWNNLARTTP